MYEGSLQTKSKLIDPSNWHLTRWFSSIHSHSVDGATGLAQLLPFEQPGYKNSDFERSKPT